MTSAWCCEVNEIYFSSCIRIGTPRNPLQKPAVPLVLRNALRFAHHCSIRSFSLSLVRLPWQPYLLFMIMQMICPPPPPHRQRDTHKQASPSQAFAVFVSPKCRRDWRRRRIIECHGSLISPYWHKRSLNKWSFVFAASQNHKLPWTNIWFTLFVYLFFSVKKKIIIVNSECHCALS